MTRFLAEASTEVDEAADYYERQRLGLGVDFVDEVETLLRRIESNPHRHAEIQPGVRRGLLSRFPYAVIYTLDGSDLVIVAVAHHHRRPGYWLDRV